MKNFQITSVEDGKKYWISRSCAVVAIVIRVVIDQPYILVTKRGNGVPDYKGCWCLPCGYIDWGENGQESAAREVFEETGYKINPNDFSFYGVESDPSSNLQNITLRYTCCDPYGYERAIPEGGEEDEVSEVKWLLPDEIDNFEWAFNHDKLLKDIILTLYESRVV